jgi:hypothetical protein
VVYQHRGKADNRHMPHICAARVSLHSCRVRYTYTRFNDIEVKGCDKSCLVLVADFYEIICVLEINSETIVMSGLGEPSAGVSTNQCRKHASQIEVQLIGRSIAIGVMVVECLKVSAHLFRFGG